MTEAILNLQPTAAQLIDRYIKLRDSKEMVAKSQSQFLKENYTDEMDEIELALLDKLNNEGGDNIKTSAGTAMKVHKTSITVADQREFQRHILGGELWDLIEWRPAKTAINELVAAGDPLPPGLNRNVFIEVNIRRPQK